MIRRPRVLGDTVRLREASRSNVFSDTGVPASLFMFRDSSSFAFSREAASGDVRDADSCC